MAERGQVLRRCDLHDQRPVEAQQRLEPSQHGELLRGRFLLLELREDEAEEAGDRVVVAKLGERGLNNSSVAL